MLNTKTMRRAVVANDSETRMREMSHPDMGMGEEEESVEERESKR